MQIPTQTTSQVRNTSPCESGVFMNRSSPTVKAKACGKVATRNQESTFRYLRYSAHLSICSSVFISHNDYILLYSLCSVFHLRRSTAWGNRSRILYIVSM